MNISFRRFPIDINRFGTVRNWKYRTIIHISPLNTCKCCVQHTFRFRITRCNFRTAQSIRSIAQFLAVRIENITVIFFIENGHVFVRAKFFFIFAVSSFNRIRYLNKILYTPFLFALISGVLLFISVSFEIVYIHIYIYIFMCAFKYKTREQNIRTNIKSC